MKVGQGKNLKPDQITGEAADSSSSNLQGVVLADELSSGPQNTTAAKTKQNQASKAPKQPKKSRFDWQRLANFNWKRALRYSTIALFALVCLAVSSFLLTWQSGNSSVYKQKAGDVANQTLTAPRDLTYNSPILTKKAQDDAAANPINNVYQRDQQVIDLNRERLTHLLDTINTARSQTDYLGTAPYNLLNNSDVKAANLNLEQLRTILSFSSSDWSDVNQQAYDSYGLEMTRDIHPGQLPDEIKRVNDAINNPWNFSLPFARLTQTQRQIVAALFTPYLAENSPLDLTATKQRQQEASQKVQLVARTIKKDEIVVRQGEMIDPLQGEAIAQFSPDAGAYSWQSTIGTVGILTTLLVLMLSYFSLLFNQLWQHPRILSFLGLLLVVAAAAIRIAVSDPTDHTLRPFLLPLATVSLLLTALFDVNLALFMTMLLALLAGYVGQSSEVAAVIFVGGAAGALILWKAERSIVFAYAGVAICVAQFVVALCFALVNHTLDFLTFGLLLLACAANALVSTSLAFFSFSVLGKFFGVTTVLSLLELAHPNQPLLRRLMREAPGTYHHSVMVSNLAEQAAEQVAGEALLARVGAYYHDIGKLTRPAFFIDNQGSGPNIHDTLDPRESAKLIRAHVADGVALARKHNLPRRVTEIIHQHHGTCLVSFFYNKAVSMGLDVNEVDFRYPGPKPQTKIAAIVMLADGSEAAVRANVQTGRIATGASSPVPGSPNPDPAIKRTTIASVVNKIIDDRLSDHQLDECDLTLRDIEDIRRIFIQVLTDIYHPRINYPDTVHVTNPHAAVPAEGIVITSVTPLVAALPAPAEPPAAITALSSVNSPATSEKPATGSATAILERPTEQPKPLNRTAPDQITKPQPLTDPTSKDMPSKNKTGGIGGAGRPVQNK